MTVYRYFVAVLLLYSNIVRCHRHCAAPVAVRLEFEVGGREQKEFSFSFSIILLLNAIQRFAYADTLLRMQRGRAPGWTIGRQGAISYGLTPCVVCLKGVVWREISVWFFFNIFVLPSLPLLRPMIGHEHSYLWPFIGLSEYARTSNVRIFSCEDKICSRMDSTSPYIMALVYYLPFMCSVWTIITMIVHPHADSICQQHIPLFTREDALPRSEHFYTDLADELSFSHGLMIVDLCKWVLSPLHFSLSPVWVEEGCCSSCYISS